MRIEIDRDACRGCRICVDICPTKVLAHNEEAWKAEVVEAADCIACLSCSYQCPSGAIRHLEYHVVKNFYRERASTAMLERLL